MSPLSPLSVLAGALKTADKITVSLECIDGVKLRINARTGWLKPGSQALTGLHRAPAQVSPAQEARSSASKSERSAKGNASTKRGAERLGIIDPTRGDEGGVRWSRDSGRSPQAARSGGAPSRRLR
jgi:hypothetical protein